MAIPENVCPALCDLLASSLKLKNTLKISPHQQAFPRLLLFFNSRISLIKYLSKLPLQSDALSTATKILFQVPSLLSKISPPFSLEKHPP